MKTRSSSPACVSRHSIIPEPSTGALLAAAIASLVALRRCD
jgi:hypothetical protein